MNGVRSTSAVRSTGALFRRRLTSRSDVKRAQRACLKRAQRACRSQNRALMRGGRG